MFPSHSHIFTRSALFLLLLCSIAWAEGTIFQASDQSFTVKLPSTFSADQNPPGQTVLAAVIPNSGVSLYCDKREAEEVSADVFAEQAKRNLYDNGAQIYGKAKASLGNKPAARAGLGPGPGSTGTGHAAI